MKENKTRHFGYCIALFGFLLLMYISLLTAYVYYYVRYPVILEGIFNDYFLSFGLNPPMLRDITIAVLVVIAFRIIVSSYYLYKSIRFSIMTKVQFMDKNRKYTLDFVLLLLLGLVPMLVYLVVCENNNIPSYTKEPVNLPYGVSPNLVNAVRTLQAYRDSGRISEEAYNQMIVDIFVESGDDKK